MKIADIINIADLHQAAKRRMPRVAFDYFEGGAEDEAGLARNERAFRDHRLVPRYLVDVTEIDQSTTIFGRTYASPFGIAPTGVGGLLRPGADLMVAQAAAEANIPYTLSGLSTTRLEDVAQTAPGHAWFQLYGMKERSYSEDMIRRADAAGYRAMMFTVDVPVISKREREMHNRFGQPRLPLRLYLEALRHPAWLLEYLRNGIPYFANWAPYAEKGLSAKQLLPFITSQFPTGDHTWRDLENFRRIWPHKLVIKGLLHPGDARRAADLGVEGVVVSNHGGRQLDSAPSALEVLPAIRAAVGDRMTVMMDGGVRRGADIVIAKALGADFVFVGRPAIYGVAAFGLPGARKAIDILRNEIEITLKQIGCPNINKLGPEFLLHGGKAAVPAQGARSPLPE